jgi:predicted TIM-barrel fold metal-dependent hydrolase
MDEHVADRVRTDPAARHGAASTEADPMAIVDAQIHPYERDHPGRPWAAALPGPPEVTGDQLVAAMDEVGVDAAILVSAFAMYRYDASYAVSVRNAHPARFALVKPVDIADPAVGEVIEDWAQTPGSVGVRILVYESRPVAPTDRGLNRAVAAAARASLPVNIACVGNLDLAAALARAHPDCRLVIDHLGLRQPMGPQRLADPFGQLPKVLELARCENVAIKVSGVCTLSHERYPFADIWRPLWRVFEAYGFDRCMWGTDWTRACDFLSFREGVEAFQLNERLTRSERAALMGGTLQSIYEWRPSSAGGASPTATG